MNIVLKYYILLRYTKYIIYLDIQATLLRTASFYFDMGGLHKCSLVTMTIYLTILSTTDLIIIRQVAQPPTFRPPVDDATILHCRLVKDFYRT